MTDPIIAEVWKNRDKLAARYGHDLDAIVAALKKRQRQPFSTIIKPVPRRTHTKPTPQRAR